MCVCVYGQAVQKLDSIQDTDHMEIKMAKDISSIMGIPFELIGGGYTDRQGGKKALENNRVFTTNMMTICKHLQNLLSDIYRAIYGGEVDDVIFTLRATPRIEVGSVDDIRTLIELGLVSFDNAMTISNMLLGVDLEQGSGKVANAGQFTKPYVTPTQKKDLLMVAAAQERRKQAVSTPQKDRD